MDLSSFKNASTQQAVIRHAGKFTNFVEMNFEKTYYGLTGKSSKPRTAHTAGTLPATLKDDKTNKNEQ